MINPGVFFNAGRISNTFPTGTSSNQGGGIRQSFDFTGGDLDISVAFNAAFSGVGSTARGIISAILIGPDSSTALEDSFDFADAGRRADEATGSLSLQTVTDLLAGVYTLEVSFTRAFLISSDVLFGLTEIDATSQTGGPGGGVVETPEPGIIALLLIAVAGFAATRKRKQVIR